jgi:hypothetical protein
LRGLNLPDPSLSNDTDDGLAERGYPSVSGVRSHVAIALVKLAPQLRNDVTILTRLRGWSAIPSPR